MYLETVTAPFMEGIDSFVKAAKAYAGNNVPSSKGYIHNPCVDCKNEKAFRIDDVEQIRYHLLSRGFMKNYKVWNMHGEEGDNLPEETIQGPLPETTTNETLTARGMAESGRGGGAPRRRGVDRSNWNLRPWGVDVTSC